jgi:hypothetical protein
MTITAFLPVPIFRAFDSAGNSLAGGQLFAYAAGTTTPQNTYSDAAGITPNANPVILDSTGSATVRLGSLAYKFVLKDAGGSTQWTEDNYLAGGGDSPTYLALTVTTLTVGGNAAVVGNSTIGGTLAVIGQTTLTGDTIARGMPVCRFKAADTARQNNTLTNDPDLTYAIPTTGTYQVECMLEYDSVAAGAGFKFGFAFSGSIAGGATPGSIVGSVNAAPYATPSSGMIGGTSIQTTVSTSANTQVVNFTTAVTAIGTLTLQWAQNSTTASNTTLRTGSYLKVTKLS